MPNNNSTQQTTDDSQQPAVTFPSVSVEDTLPPTITTTTVTAPSVAPQDTVNPSPANTTPSNNGSAAPSNDLAMSGVIGTTPPKKKFAGGKVIATILGLFLLVGGVGAGVFLTGQNQNISEKATGNYTELGGNGTYCTKARSGCDVGSLYPGKYVAHYHCNTTDPGPNGCGDEVPGEEAVQSATFSFNCGSEQIDAGPNLGANEFISRIYETPCEPGSLQCINAIVLYSEQGTMITDLGTLKAGQKVFITIPIAYGANNTLNFTKARFTVNGVLRPEVTHHKKFQVADVFYDEYTVTSGTTNILAEVYYAGAWYGK